MKTILKTTILLLFILFFKNSFSQEKQQPQKIVLEMELEQVIKLKVPAVYELNKTAQTYPHKNKSETKECLPKNKINIPKNNALIKEEDYNENNK